MMEKSKKVPLIFLILSIIVAMSGYFFYHEWKDAQENQSRIIYLSGNVDVREVAASFRASDRISEILVKEGDTVKKGQSLARLDDSELKLIVNKAKAQVAAQQSYVDKLHNGTRQEEIQQAEANLQAAEAAAQNAAGVYSRYKALYDQTEGISAQQLENALHDMQAKKAAAQAASHALEESVNGARDEDVAAGEATLSANQNELDRQEYLLSQYELKSPVDGVIRSRLLEIGDMASPQAPVFKISLLDKKWVRAYVNETQLGKIYEGQSADIKIDSQDELLKGQIGYISSTAEFTPKTVQTEELRTALVYEIRVYVDDEANVLRLGMPASVEIKL